MKKNICLHLDNDGMTCKFRNRLTKCIDKCLDYIEDLSDITIEEWRKQDENK